MKCELLLLACLLQISLTTGWQRSHAPRLSIVTIATSETDGFRRFKKSVEEFGHDLHVFGMGQKWLGGNMETAVILYMSSLISTTRI